MKFIHIADVHLYAEPDKDKSWGKERKIEIESTFDDVLDICEKEQIELLLIAGNLFHVPPTLEMLEALDEKFQKFTKTKTVIIAGDCDYIAEDSPVNDYKFKSKAVILPRDKATNAFLKDLKVCITGYSYGQPEYRERVLETLNPARKGVFNILLGHGGDGTHMPFSKSVLAKKGFDYVALGHISKPSHILKNRMAFSGSLEPISSKEVGRRGYILGEIYDDPTTNADCKRSVEIKWIPFNKKSYINLSINVNASEGLNNDQICEELEKQIRKLGYDNIYTIILKGYVYMKQKYDFSKIIERYNVLEVLDRTLTYSEEEMIRVHNSSNIIGSFINEVNGIGNMDDNMKRKILHYGIDSLISGES